MYVDSYCVAKQLAGCGVTGRLSGITAYYSRFKKAFRFSNKPVLTFREKAKKRISQLRCGACTHELFT